MSLKTDITALILAGGEARRMGGTDKGLIKLNNKPLIEYVIDSLQSQVDNIIINANRSHEEYAKYGLDVVTDTQEGFQGPLAGMLTGLKHCKTDYLLCVPCDSPFCPGDVAARLYKSLEDNNSDIAVAFDGERIHPVFNLLKKELFASLEVFLANGQRKIDRWFEQHKFTHCDYSDMPQAFLNINSPEELNEIEKKIMIQTEKPLLGFAAFSGTGKTTLLENIIPLLNARGVRVGVIKHAHHEFDIDQKGKDSYKIRKAGAKQMLIGSKHRWALMVEQEEEDHILRLENYIKHLDMDLLDIILVEGFKPEAIPKIELHRPSLNSPFIHKEDASIIAIASDEPITPNRELTQLDINNHESIVDFICNFMSDFNNE